MMNPAENACETRAYSCVVGNHLKYAEEKNVVTEIDGTWVVKPNGHEKLTLVAPKCDAADSVCFRMPKVATGADGASERCNFSQVRLHGSQRWQRSEKIQVSNEPAKRQEQVDAGCPGVLGRQARSRWSAAGSGPDTR